MSVRVMTAVWDITLGDSDKIVLLALADCANDEGHCWPSMATLAKKCSKGERTVQGVIKRLVEAGHITRREVPGKGCDYLIHPRSGCAPAAAAPRSERRQPPQRLRHTPAAAADKPSMNHKEPSGERARARAAAPVLNDGNGKGEARGQRLPLDWTPPPVADLPPLAAELVRRWPAGAYEAACEAFRLHWTGATGRSAMKRDWLAALGKWLITDYDRVMRAAKAGVSFEAALPVEAAGTVAKVRPVAARRREDAASLAVHAWLKDRLGELAYAQWIEPAAILFDDADVAWLVVILPKPFHRDWVRDHFAADIRAAVKAVAGRDLVGVHFEVAGLADKLGERIDG